METDCQKKTKTGFRATIPKSLHDECLMAVVFGDNGPLLAKILAFSHPSEYGYVTDLFANKIDITFSNGNLVISN
jgi:hypothetical protein